MATNSSKRTQAVSAQNRQNKSYMKKRKRDKLHQKLISCIGKSEIAECSEYLEFCKGNAHNTFDDKTLLSFQLNKKID